MDENTKASTYQVAGYEYGSFVGREGNSVSFCNLYVISPIEKRQGRFSMGFKSSVFKVTSPQLLSDLTHGDHVELGFNQYGRVNRIVKVAKKADDSK